MTGVTESGIAIAVPSRQRRRLEPVSDDEARRIRVALARVLAETGYSARDRAKILCVPKSTLHDLEATLAETLESGVAGGQ